MSTAASASAVAFDAEPESADEWVVLSTAAGPSAGPAAPTPKAQALAKAAAAEAAAANSAAELAAAQRELTAVRAELALTRGRLAAAEHESARLTALSAQQRHTITHLSNQLQLVTAAGGAPVPPAAADDSSSAAALAAAAAAGDGHAAPLRAAELRAQRRAAKASKHHTKGACKPAVPLVLSTKQPVRAS